MPSSRFLPEVPAEGGCLHAEVLLDGATNLERVKKHATTYFDVWHGATSLLFPQPSEAGAAFGFRPEGKQEPVGIREARSNWLLTLEWFWLHDVEALEWLTASLSVPPHCDFRSRISIHLLSTVARCPIFDRWTAGLLTGADICKSDAPVRNCLHIRPIECVTGERSTITLSCRW